MPARIRYRAMVITLGEMTGCRTVTTFPSTLPFGGGGCVLLPRGGEVSRSLTGRAMVLDAGIHLLTERLVFTNDRTRTRG